ncbi:protein-tyrosine phosphatase-like protein [Mycena rebaudengoi]|nr:protein-tyrosine phosphatase-like protein [Mycena rebaudengoi]
MVDPQPEVVENGFRRMVIPVIDWPDQELLIHFKAANAFIDDARISARESVLVHCHQGVSRSATIVAAYLMATHPPVHGAASAIKFLKNLRPIVQPNSGFLDQLELYGRRGCNLDDTSGRLAIEAWRAEQERKWEGRVDRMNRERLERERSNRWGSLRLWAGAVFS